MSSSSIMARLSLYSIELIALYLDALGFHKVGDV